MAFLFDSFKEGIIGGGTFAASDFQLDSDTLKVVLIDTGDFNPVATTEQVSDMTPDPKVGTPTTIAVAGVADGAVTVTGNSTTMTSVTGDISEEVLVYDDTITNDPLICVFEVGDSADLPVTPNTGDITINWNASGIFAF